MTVRPFNVCTCSDQDFAVKLLTNYNAVMRGITWLGRRPSNAHLSQAALHLHGAMGYRAEHSDPLAF